MYPYRRVSLCAFLCLLSFRLLALVQVAKGETPTREEIEQAWRTRYCQLLALSSSERISNLRTTYGSFHGEYGFSKTDVFLESAISEKPKTFTVIPSQFQCSTPPTLSDYTWCVRLMVPSHNVTSCVSNSGRTESEVAHILGIGDNMDVGLDDGALRLRNVSRIYFYAIVSAIVRTGSCNEIVSFVVSIKEDVSNIGRFNTVIPDKTWVVGRTATAECSYVTTKPSHYLALYRNSESLPYIVENPYCTSDCMFDNRTITGTLRMDSTRVYYWWQTNCYSSEKTLYVTLKVDNVSNADVGLYRCKVEAEGGIVVNESPVANITLFNDIIEIEQFANTSVDVDVREGFSSDCRSKALDDRDWKTVWIAPSGDVVPEVTTDTICGSKTAPNLFSQVRTESKEEGGVSKKVQILTLFICSMDERYGGLYTCRVDNEMDVANETIVVNVQTRPRSTGSSETPSVVVGVVVAVIVLFVLLAMVVVMSCVLYIRKNRNKTIYGVRDIDEEVKYPSPSKSGITAINSPSEKRSVVPVDINSSSDERNINTIDGGGNPCPVRVDNKWKYPQERFSVIGELGSGQYGRVVHASAPGILPEQPEKDKVAAKTVKDHARPQDLQSICEEIELMAAIDPHTNILNLLGFTMKDQRPYLIMEYAKYGDLHRLLKKCKEEMKRQNIMRSNSGSTSSSGYYNVDTSRDRLLSSSSGICSPVSSVPAGTPVLPSISEDQVNPGGVTPFTTGDDTVFESDVAYIKSPESCAAHNIRPLHSQYQNYPHELIPDDILNFALQIAQGMEHLHRNKIIHRDLAARNILITEDCVLKIADFGLARVKDDNDYYKIATERGLPIRWTAPEVFRNFKYSSKSDVWSYAILLWEITSYGDTPFREYGFSDLPRHLENGGRPHREAVCNDELFELMKDCWSLSPQDRPSFKEITRRLSLESCPSSPMAVKYYPPGLQGGDVPPHIASSLTHT